MMRAFIKVDPDTGEVRAHSECPVHFDDDGNEIPLKDVSSQGYLQIEVPVGTTIRDTFSVDLASMKVSITPYRDLAPKRRDDPEFVATLDTRKAKAAQRIAALGKPINSPKRISQKVKASRSRLVARDGG